MMDIKNPKGKKCIIYGDHSAGRENKNMASKAINKAEHVG